LRRLRLFKEMGMNRGAAIEQVLIGAMLVMVAVSLFAIASGYDFLGLTLFMTVAVAVRLLAAKHARRLRRTATPTARDSCAPMASRTGASRSRMIWCESRSLLTGLA